jgi:predicted Zn-dependent protease
MPDALSSGPDLASAEPAGAAAGLSAQAAFELGVAARRSGDREAAAGWFRQALAADPGHRAARVEIATALRELGRLEEAEAEYRRLLEAQPGWFFPLLGLGLCARRRRDMPAALDYLAAAAAAAPATERASRQEYATALRELGRPEDAEPVYRALLADHPGWFPALLGLGLCARLRRDLPTAAEHFAAALAAAPQDRGARHEYATTLRELGRLTEAEAEYGTLLADHPGWFPALLGLGLCARRRGDLPAAAEHLAAALAAAPRERAARLEYATTLRELHRAEDAEAVYRALLADEPGSFHAVFGLGLCARLRRDLPTALGYFATATAITPRDRSARLEYAATLRELQRPEEAEAVYRALLADEPGAFHALLGLGLCARLRRDLPAAARHLAAAVAAAPRDRSARLEYAATLRELQRPEEAEAVYRALLADEPGLFQALLGLGLCARLRNDRAAALARFQAAAEAMPGAAAAWLEILTEYGDAGRLDEARGIAGRLLERDPALAQGWLGLGRVERQAGDRAAALEAFRQGFTRCPGQPHFLLEMAIEAQALGRFAEAESWLREAAAVDHLAARALTQLGEQARMAQRLEAALELFRRAVARPDAPAGAHAALAQVLADLGRLDEALAALDGAEQQAGGRPELALKRAGLLRRAGWRDEALAVARAASAAAPGHFPLWFERFENERFSGMHDAGMHDAGMHDAGMQDAGALDGLDALLDAAPAVSLRDRAMLHHARGLLAEQRWQLAAAAAEHRRAAALDGALGAVHEALARVSLLQCDPQTARQHLLAGMRLNAPQRQLQGLSLHLVHTHLGQILDEFLMDPATLRAAADALALPAGKRIAALLALVRREPDHTPAAIALLVALRQAGCFARAPDAAAEDAQPGRIPAGIAQYWDEATPPADVARLMQSWPEQNPGHRYVRFDTAAAAAFLAGHCTRDVQQAFRRAREPAMKADLFRLAYLFCEGGVYADADDRCLRPLAAVLPAGADFVLYQEEYGTLGNNFIAAGRFHPVLGLALRLAVQAINRGDDDLLWLATGPGLLSRAFVQALAASCLTVPAWLARIAVLQRHELARGVATACAAAYKTTRRYWARAAFGERSKAPPGPARGQAPGP